MAIAAAGWQVAAGGGANPTFTLSATVPAGSNDVVLIGFAHGRDLSGAVGASEAVSATFGATAMTKVVGAVTAQESANENGIAIFALALGNVAADDTQTISFTWSEAISGRRVGACYLTGASQTLPSTLVAGAHNITGAALSAVINSVPAGALVVSAVGGNAGNPYAPTGTDQTEQVEDASLASATTALSSTVVAGAGNITTGWSPTSAPGRWAMASAAFEEAGALPPAGMVHPPAGRRFQHMIVR